MIRSNGKDRKAFLADFMVGDKKGGPLIIEDAEKRKEKINFLIRERENIIREVLNLAQQVDSARVRLTRTELMEIF